MSDEPRDVRAAAPPTLREYLADRDVPCEQCGYNLRGAQDVFCPECGAVIPRPPAEHVARLQLDPAALKLWCPECDYVVTGVNAERCPECGATGLARFSGQKPRMRRRFWWRPRGLPGPLWLNAACGSVVLFLAAAQGISGLYASKPASLAVLAVLAIIQGAVPVLIAAAWVWERRAIQRMSAANRVNLSGVAFLVGLTWLGGLLVLR